MKKLMTVVLLVTLATQVIVASQPIASREGCVTLEGFGKSHGMPGLCIYAIPVDLINGSMQPIKRLTVESGGIAETAIRARVKESGIVDYSLIQRVLIHQKSGTILLALSNDHFMEIGCFNQRINA